MNSPFIGMDPYLEGSLWSDVHHELIGQLKRILVPLIRPKYVARVERYVVKDTYPEKDRGIMYPDVGVYLNAKRVEEPMIAYGDQRLPTPPTISIAITEPVEVRIYVLEIRDVDNNQLITAIEVLSPVNKRKPGLAPYLAKREKLYQEGIHLLEIDLLRRGTRPFAHKKLVDAFYVIALTRANEGKTDIWSMDLDTSLPTIPIPLMEGDEDVLVDMQAVLNEVYKNAAYDLSIDYSKPPPPPKLAEHLWKNIQKSPSK